MGKLAKKILSRARIGDRIEYITEKTGIKSAVERINGGKPCSGCGRRKKILNGE